MNYGNGNSNQQKHKTHYFLASLIGFVIGISVLSYATAQFSGDYKTIDTIAEQAIDRQPTPKEVSPILTDKGNEKPIVRSVSRTIQDRPSDNSNEESWVLEDVNGLSVIEAIKSIWVPTSYAETIVNTCKATGKDWIRCSEFAAAIPAIESSLFKRCGYDGHNCYWLWGESKLMTFKSVEAGIIYWIWQWNEHRYNNKTAKDYITRSWYCKWDCSDLSSWSSNWTRVVQWTINKIRKFY